MLYKETSFLLFKSGRMQAEITGAVTVMLKMNDCNFSVRCFLCFTFSICSLSFAKIYTALSGKTVPFKLKDIPPKIPPFL